MIASALTSLLLLAAADNNVEWSGVSHVAWQDRRPLCPMNGETFEVRVQTWTNDLTQVRVHVDDGSTAWVTAAKDGTRGPYDIWAAQVPATAATNLAYWVELTDGTDTDYLSVGGVTDATPADGGYALDFVTLEHAPVGATLVNGGGAVFRVWAPTRTSVHVRGDFNGWSTANPLTKVGEHFIGHISNALDRHMYKYFFNGTVWNTDARGRALNAGNNDNAHIEDPFRYTWTVEDFDTPSLEELVIYQLNVGTFAGRNDPVGAAPLPSRYIDVANRAAHLAELGVNAVMVNPITEFPGDLSVGYNPATQWAPEWAYGDPDDLKNMVDVLHQHGIAVLTDIVWNHFAASGNFMWWYDGSQTYFDDPAVDTPWGAQADFDATEVRSYYLDSAALWFEEYKIDGFRMDATDFMNIFPQEASGWSLMQAMNDLVDRRWADKLIIAEQLPDDSWVTRPTSQGGAGFDTQYYDAFTDNLRQEVIDAGFGDPDMWRIRDIINGGGANLQFAKIVNYLELHDEVWPTSGGQRMVQTIDTVFPHDDEWARGRVKLAQGLVMSAPGVPAIVMGTEWLEDAGYGSDAVNRIDWAKKTTYATTFDYFTDLVALRKTNPALRANAYVSVFHVNEGGNLLAFRRTDFAGQDLIVIANFSNGDYNGYRLGVPQSGNWHEILNSQDVTYGESGPSNPSALGSEGIASDGFVQSVVLEVPAMGLLVLQYDSGMTDAPVVAGAPQGFHLERAAPNPIRSGGTSLAFRLSRPQDVRLTVHDPAGRLVTVLETGRRAAGSHSVTWDGLDAVGRPVASGVYLLRLEAAEGTASRKVTVLR